MKCIEIMMKDYNLCFVTGSMAVRCCQQSLILYSEIMLFKNIQRKNYSNIKCREVWSYRLLQSVWWGAGMHEFRVIKRLRQKRGGLHPFSHPH